jgi:hypothetical protein
VADPTFLRVEVKSHNATELKIVWTAGDLSWLPYFVDRAEIRAIGAEVRAALTELVIDAKTNQRIRGAELLRGVARAGRRLYDALFRAVEGRDHADDARSWLEHRAGPDRIGFRVEDRIHVPWGLIYDGNVEALSPVGPGDDPDPYEDFWCLKHWVATTYFRVEPRGLDVPLPAESFRMLSILNQNVFDRVRTRLRAPELAVLASLEGFRDPIYRSGDFFTLWQKLATDVGILYFYCHADGTRLALGATDLITVERLREELAVKGAAANKPACIVFLNGCATAVGAAAGGFLEATGGRGFCGFIGTETRVPDVFAKRFALAFFQEFFRGGSPLFEVMDRLRHRHWPLGLLYGMYCYPLLRVLPANRHVFDTDCFTDNLSRADLGTDELLGIGFTR